MKICFLSLLVGFVMTSCSGQNDSPAYRELDALIDLSSELPICIDSEGVPYYDGYTVSNEKFNEYIVGAGWSCGNDEKDMYDVMESGPDYFLKESKPWEPPYIYNFHVNSSTGLTDYIFYYIYAQPYDVLLYKNSDYVYSPDGTVRLSDGSFFMRVVYASPDVFQAFKCLYTDLSGKAHYALCTFKKMTQDQLTDFRDRYTTDYYTYISETQE